MELTTAISRHRSPRGRRPRARPPAAPSSRNRERGGREVMEAFFILFLFFFFIFSRTLPRGFRGSRFARGARENFFVAFVRSPCRKSLSGMSYDRWATLLQAAESTTIIVIIILLILLLYYRREVVHRSQCEIRFFTLITIVVSATPSPSARTQIALSTKSHTEHRPAITSRMILARLHRHFRADHHRSAREDARRRRRQDQRARHRDRRRSQALGKRQHHLAVQVLDGRQ